MTSSTKRCARCAGKPAYAFLGRIEEMARPRAQRLSAAVDAGEIQLAVLAVFGLIDERIEQTCSALTYGK